MSKRVSGGGEKPWPTRYVCRDGVVRNLAEHIPEQWWTLPWRRERASIAHSLGRKALPEISAMTGSDGPEPLCW
jgi:hypothetical protein